MSGTASADTRAQPRRVLVVDDEPRVRDLVVRHFRRAGDQVVSAGSAEEVRAHGHTRRHWDVVIADIHLPGLSGVELARQLSHKTNSLVLMTGDTSQGLAREALRNLHAGYLLKPFELFELDAIVKLANRSSNDRSLRDRWFGQPSTTEVQQTSTDRVPLRALIISIAALALPIAATLLRSDSIGANDYLLWVSALVPPFLLAFYRGWRGAASALALGMASFAIAHVVGHLVGAALPAPDTVFALTTVFIVTCLGTGWLSNQLHAKRRVAELSALTDSLTGLSNRAHLQQYLKSRINVASEKNPLAMVFFDLDHFKRWNDELGHEAGDQALVAFADVLRRHTRAMEFTVRYGGEEFVTVLNADLPAAMLYANRIRDGLAKLDLYGRTLTVSMGIALWNSEMREPADLINDADAAAYAAKAAGRDCIRVFGTDNTECDVPLQLQRAS